MTHSYIQSMSVSDGSVLQSILAKPSLIYLKITVNLFPERLPNLRGLDTYLREGWGREDGGGRRGGREGGGKVGREGGENNHHLF